MINKNADKIIALRKEIEVIKSEERTIKDKLILKRIELVELETGFKNGEKVITDGKVGILVITHPYYCLKIRRYKNNGELSNVLNYANGEIERIEE